jgi:hypothetical protein
MAYITEKYEPVKLTARKNLPCPGCGKKVRRQRTFEQTVSPFNRNVKPGMSRNEAINAIRKALMDKSAAWKREPVLCGDCLESGAES